MKTTPISPKTWRWWQWGFILSAAPENFPGINVFDHIQLMWNDYDWVDREFYSDSIGGE